MTVSQIALLMVALTSPTSQIHDVDNGVETGCQSIGIKTIEDISVTLARGILRIKKTWWSCGVKLSDTERAIEAISISKEILNAMGSLGSEFTPWGVLGVMANESGFDRCALGKNPRRWAYENRMMDQNTMTISHSSESVLNFVNSEKAKKQFSKTGFDIGLCQILSRFYQEEIDDMIETKSGTRICILEMLQRNKSKPWLYWRGKATEWYRLKIINWAKRMGAPKREVNRI